MQSLKRPIPTLNASKPPNASLPMSEEEFPQMSQLSSPQLFLSSISSPQIAFASPNQSTSSSIGDEAWWGYSASLASIDDGLSEIKIQSRFLVYGSEYLGSGTVDTVDPRLLTRSSSSRAAGETIEVLGNPFDEIQSWKRVMSGEGRIRDEGFTSLTVSDSSTSATEFQEQYFQEDPKECATDDNPSYVIERHRYLLRPRHNSSSLNDSITLPPERTSRQSSLSRSSPPSLAIPEPLPDAQRISTALPTVVIDVPLKFGCSPQPSYSLPINPSFLPSPPNSITRSPSPTPHINAKNDIVPNNTDIITTEDLTGDSMDLILVPSRGSTLSPPPTDFEPRTPQLAGIRDPLIMSTSPGPLPLTKSLPPKRSKFTGATPTRGIKRKHEEGRQGDESTDQPRNRRSIRHQITHNQLLSLNNETRPWSKEDYQRLEELKAMPRHFTMWEIAERLGRNVEHVRNVWKQRHIWRTTQWNKNKVNLPI